MTATADTAPVGRLERARLNRAHGRAARRPELEWRDACDKATETLAMSGRFTASPAAVRALAAARTGGQIIGNGQVLKSIRGMGTIYDWRASSWTPVNGGRIRPLVFVQHIPVVANQPGIADFITLRNVLVAQGLMVQAATDREGNVGLFAPFNVLCFQAKGANQQSCGCEHMHATTGEPWSKRQLRAMAWLIQLAERKHAIPHTRGRLGEGNGVVRVLERGQVWHSEVSHAAGFDDRIDPWGVPARQDMRELWAYVQHCIGFYATRGHFEGA